MASASQSQYIAFYIACGKASSFLQVFERYGAVLEHLILVSIEGYVRDWDWNGVNSISTPYFGAVHWHRGKRQQEPILSDIIASKQHFALLSAKIRNYGGKLRFHHHRCQILHVPGSTAMLLALIFAVSVTKSTSVSNGNDKLFTAVRYRLHKDCIASENDCTFIDWNTTEISTNQLAAQTFSNMTSAW